MVLTPSSRNLCLISFVRFFLVCLFMLVIRSSSDLWLPSSRSWWCWLCTNTIRKSLTFSESKQTRDLIHRFSSEHTLLYLWEFHGVLKVPLWSFYFLLLQLYKNTVWPRPYNSSTIAFEFELWYNLEYERHHSFLFTLFNSVNGVNSRHSFEIDSHSRHSHSRQSFLTFLECHQKWHMESGFQRWILYEESCIFRAAPAAG